MAIVVTLRDVRLEFAILEPIIFVTLAQAQLI